MATQNTELADINKNFLATIDEAENILEAARETAGFEELLKFRKGEYFIGNELVPLGTEFLAHPEAWTKCWIKFSDNKVVDRRVYPVASGARSPERHELGDEDQTDWPVGLDGRPSDPWCLQHLLPLENVSSGEVVVFTTSSFGGIRGVSDLCAVWANRERKGKHGQPIVKLQSAEMPTKKFGKVPRPKFEIVGWSDTVGDVFEAPPAVNSEEEFKDQILY